MEQVKFRDFQVTLCGFLCVFATKGEISSLKYASHTKGKARKGSQIKTLPDSDPLCWAV